MMDKEVKNILNVFLATLGVVAVICYIGYRSQRSTPGTAAWSQAQERTRMTIADWPEPSRSLAEVMAERYGPPERFAPQALTWKKSYPWKRIVVRREGDAPLEHVVDYELAPSIAKLVRGLGHGIRVDTMRGEIAARGDREQLNFLALNLADEIAEGRRSPEKARAFYAEAVEFSAAGKSSPYMEGLLFKPRKLMVGRWETTVQY